MRLGVGRGEEALLDGLRAEPSVSRPRPSSETRMTTLPPRWKASSVIVPCRGFPAASAGFRRFDAVVGRVADRMDQRIAQLVDHPLVEFGLLAADGQADVLAVGAGDVADDAMEPGEQRPDRHHAHVHGALLNAVGDAVEQVDRLEQVADQDFGRPVAVHRLLQAVADLRETRLADDQLAGQIHQLVEPLDVHAQRFGGLGGKLGRLADGPLRARPAAGSGRRQSTVAGTSFTPLGSAASHSMTNGSITMSRIPPTRIAC